MFAIEQVDKMLQQINIIVSIEIVEIAV